MEDFKKILKEFVEIKSVSTDSKYKKEILKASRFLSSYLTKSGLKVEVVKGYENPVIIARTKYQKGKKTVLIYGHYDVQPSADYRLIVKNGKLCGRGTADNKGQILVYLYTVASLIKEKGPNYNVIFLIEGNEETGSSKLGRLVRKFKNKLKCDCVLISDSELARGDKPAMEASFRGAMNFEVIVKTADEEKHSGLFGGAEPNAAEELSKIIMGLSKLIGPKTGYIPGTAGYDKRVGIGGTIEVTGLSSGYMGEGFKNAIPAVARAKINLRSAPTQDPQEMFIKIVGVVKKNTSKNIEVRIIKDATKRGMEIDLSNAFAKKAARILHKIHGVRPKHKRAGGTLPISSELDSILKVPQVMVPFADHNCGAHSDSEFISIKSIEKALQFSREFLGVEDSHLYSAKK